MTELAQSMRNHREGIGIHRQSVESDPRYKVFLRRVTLQE
jgi:hypothetical protein